MARCDGWGGCVLQCGCLGLGLTTLLCVVSVATPNWAVGAVFNQQEARLGLWSACLDVTCVSLYDQRYTKELMTTLGNWYYVVQGLSALNLALLALVWVLLCCFLCCGRCQQRPDVFKLSSILILTACALFLFMTLSYAYEIRHRNIVADQHLHFGFSFYVALVCFPAFVATVTLFILEHRRRASRSTDFYAGGYIRINN